MNRNTACFGNSMTPLICSPVRQTAGTRLIAALLLFGCALMNAGCAKPQSNDAGSTETVSPSQLSESAAPANVTAAPPGAGMLNTPFIVPAVTDPPMLTAETATLGPDEMVIGVIDGDISRAWCVTALSSVQSHVVIDTRGPQPLAVTWCDRSRCARVLAGQPGSDLQVQTAGFINGEMWLRVEGRMLPQSSQEMPLSDQTSTLTSWREWKAAHPDTSVYAGAVTEPAE
jgi:hypothetical protein